MTSGRISTFEASGSNFAFDVQKPFATAHGLDISARDFIAIDTVSEQQRLVQMILADFTPENAGEDMLIGHADLDEGATKTCNVYGFLPVPANPLHLFIRFASNSKLIADG